MAPAWALSAPSWMPTVRRARPVALTALFRHPRHGSPWPATSSGADGDHHHGGPVRGDDSHPSCSSALYALWFRVREHEAAPAIPAAGDPTAFQWAGLSHWVSRPSNRSRRGRAASASKTRVTAFVRPPDFASRSSNEV